jgi:hypothetical protein
MFETGRRLGKRKQKTRDRALRLGRINTVGVWLKEPVWPSCELDKGDKLNKRRDAFWRFKRDAVELWPTRRPAKKAPGPAVEWEEEED